MKDHVDEILDAISLQHERRELRDVGVDPDYVAQLACATQIPVWADSFGKIFVNHNDEHPLS